MLQKLVKLIHHRLKNTSAGVGVGLDHLHHAFDFKLNDIAAAPGFGVKAHHAAAHAVDQAARRVVDGGKEVRLAHRHPQHRHLQPRKPNPYRRRYALFGQYALKQQRHNFDGGALVGRARGLLELLFALRQFFQQSGRANHFKVAALFMALAAAVRTVGAIAMRPVVHTQAPVDVFLGAGNGCRQARRCGHRLRGVGKVRQLPTNQAIQAAQHRFRVVRSARQRCRPGHHPGLLRDVSVGNFAFCDVSLSAGSRRSMGRQFTFRHRIARPPSCVRGASNQRPQVDLRQHAFGHQPAVGLVISLGGKVRELFMNRALHGAPSLLTEPGAAPRRGHYPRQYMGPQHIVGSQLIAPFQGGHAGAKVSELPRRHVHHRQRQPRAENFDFDGVVVDQGQTAVIAMTATRTSAKTTAKTTARAARGAAAGRRWQI